MPTTRQIADHVNGELLGPGDIQITNMNNLTAAGPSQITFIRDQSHASTWPNAKASAAIIGPQVKLEPDPGRALIRVANADLAVALLLELIAPPPVRPDPGIHPTAVIADSAIIGQNVIVGPYVVIGKNVKLGDRCIIHSAVTILDYSVLGDDCEIFPGVVIRDRCTLGDRCIIHPNAVIGADGFGFRPSADRKSIVKIPQIGTVRIGNDVEIGAGTCVDRAKFAETVIGDSTKIDNLCQIAHNCVIGKCCLIAGLSGIAGSVTIGDGVLLGGKSAIKDQVTVGNGAQLAAGSMLMNNLPANAVWGGTPAQELRITLREVAALRKLPDLLKFMRKKSI